jgi:hypothetical protein
MVNDLFPGDLVAEPVRDDDGEWAWDGGRSNSHENDKGASCVVRGCRLYVSSSGIGAMGTTSRRCCRHLGANRCPVGAGRCGLGRRLLWRGWLEQRELGWRLDQRGLGWWLGRRLLTAGLDAVGLALGVLTLRS